MAEMFEEKTSEENLGAYLKRIREAKGLSLEDLSQKTHISFAHLQEIEAGEWNKFPVEAYVRGYLNSIAVALDLNMPKILEYYSKETGSSYSQQFVAPTVLSSESSDFGGSKVGAGAGKSSSAKTVIIVIVVLAVAFFAGMNLLKKMESNTDGSVNADVVAVPAPENQNAALSEEDSTSYDSSMPEGAENVPPESLNVAAPTEKTEAKVDSAKVSAKGNSATTFITSSESKKEEKPEEVEEPVAAGTIRFSISGNDTATSWVGLYRSLSDNKVLREANITSAKSVLRYTYNDTLCVVVGNPDAVGAMRVNGKNVNVPVRKGYASRFCIAPNGKFTRR